MTKQDYILIARALSQARSISYTHVATLNDVIVLMSNEFKADNPSFDRTKFINACLGTPQP